MIKPHNIVMLVGFLEVWRVEVQWRSFCKHMFTCRSVYKYLCLLIDQSPRDKEQLRQALNQQLGGTLCVPSEPVLGATGRKSWVMPIDNMDQMADDG